MGGFAAQVDAFIRDIESLDEAAEPAPLPRTASGTPTIPPPSEAAAFRGLLACLPACLFCRCCRCCRCRCCRCCRLPCSAAVACLPILPLPVVWELLHCC